MLNDVQNKAGDSVHDSQEYAVQSSANTRLKPSRKSDTKIIDKTLSKDSLSSSISKQKNTDAANIPKIDSESNTYTDTKGSSAFRDLMSLAVRRTRQRLKNNWNAKLASLILAILVWSLISASEQATKQLTVAVPLTILGQPTLSEAYPLPKNIELRLAGTNARLEDLRVRDLTATVDLRNVSGEFQERVRVTRPRGIEVESYSPEIIAGKVE